MTKPDDGDWFPSDVGHTQAGCVVSLRATVSLEIIKHCALITAQVTGEDSAGRQKLDALPPEFVAARAADIADALISVWEARGWIRPPTLTPEQDWAEAGRLASVKARTEYARIGEELGVPRKEK